MFVLRLSCSLALVASVASAACGDHPSSGHATDPNQALSYAPDADSVLCRNLGAEALSPAACPLPQPLEPNQLAAICSEPNFPATLHGGCMPGQIRTGTWQVVGFTASHLTAAFTCRGTAPGLPGSWVCGEQTLRVDFVDGSSQTFTATQAAELDPNNGMRPMQLHDCSPPTLDVSLPATGGDAAYLYLEVPDAAFVQGSHPLADAAAAATAAPDSARVSFSLSRTNRGLTYRPGQITGGQITFAAVSLDPEHTLQFTLEAKVEPPAGAAPQGLYTVYCGASDATYSGQWLVFEGT